MSAIYPATKTLRAIEEAMAADQGASFRQWQGRVMPHLDDAYRGADEGFRTHLGASVIGGECGRAIWYGFRWAVKPRFNGTTLRLFNRGHLEEGRFIALLLMIGVRVYQQDENGKQFRISSFGGHFGGSGDGVGIGIPDVPEGTAALLEFKTHNDNSFKELKKLGVRAAKLEHFVQMQTYMRHMGLSVALYMAVNKNTDEIYAEIVPLDAAFADTFIARAHKIIPMVEAPSKVQKSPGWKPCVWCDYKPVCHLRVVPERNCRTCKYSAAMEDGNWYCNVPTQPDGGGAGVKLDKQTQLVGCSQYTMNPSMHS